MAEQQSRQQWSNRGAVSTTSSRTAEEIPGTRRSRQSSESRAAERSAAVSRRDRAGSVHRTGQSTSTTAVRATQRRSGGGSAERTAAGTLWDRPVSAHWINNSGESRATPAAQAAQTADDYYGSNSRGGGKLPRARADVFRTRSFTADQTTRQSGEYQAGQQASVDSLRARTDDYGYSNRGEGKPVH